MAIRKSSCISNLIKASTLYLKVSEGTNSCKLSSTTSKKREVLLSTDKKRHQEMLIVHAQSLKVQSREEDFKISNLKSCNH